MANFLLGLSTVIAILSIIGMIVGCFPATGLTLLISASVYALNGIICATANRIGVSKEAFWTSEYENEKKQMVKDPTWLIPLSILWGSGILSVGIYDYILTPLWSDGLNVQAARWLIRSKFRLGTLEKANETEHRIIQEIAALQRIKKSIEFQLKVYDDPNLPDAATTRPNLERELRETSEKIELLQTKLTQIAADTESRAKERIQPTRLLQTADTLQARAQELADHADRERLSRQELDEESTLVRVKA